MKKESKLNGNRGVALEAVGLSKSFGGIEAVKNLSFKLYKKEILAFVGDNGAGKSTIIKCISGVYKKDAGEIFLNGKKVIINNTKEAKKHGIETMYQDQCLISILDAQSNIFLGREKVKNNKILRFLRIMDNTYMLKETIDLLSMLSIELKNIRRPVGYLSGGQQQSVVVGKAVYWKGKILIFDEPTNNLGVEEQMKTLKLIKNIRDNYDISIIVISHNMEHVFQLVDRIIVLRNGQIVGEEIKSNTTHERVVSLITGIRTGLE